MSVSVRCDLNGASYVIKNICYRDKRLRNIADAKAKGATVVLGDTAEEDSGNFLKPTIITGATKDMA
ncbi:MAG: aldehyde dehydrogenase family protein, partial [Proteobacteria bacterium]|nr:aldehyde dehydrogenase family protein [Pseudomonadota bacterium]